MEKILKQYGITPDPMQGQNFMASQKAISKVVSLARLRRNETVLEIGAGLGFLTEELAKKAKKVIAVEMDRKLASVLKKELAEYNNIQPIRGNILKTISGIRCDVIVSNLPYAISEALLRKLTTYDFKRAVLVVPKGFAYRLVANENEANYSRLSVFAQSFFNVSIITELSKSDFYPKPDTNSVVIELSKKPENLIQKLFLWESRKLKNLLLEAIATHERVSKNTARERLKRLNISNKTLDKRAREIDLKGMKTIINALKAARK